MIFNKIRELKFSSSSLRKRVAAAEAQKVLTSTPQ